MSIWLQGLARLAKPVIILCRQEQHIFTANGFSFKELEDGQVQLTAVPFSKEVVFGPQDVHELLHLLGHGDGGAFKMQTQQPAPYSQYFNAPQAATGTITKIVRPSRCEGQTVISSQNGTPG